MSDDPQQRADQPAEQPPAPNQSAKSTRAAKPARRQRRGNAGRTLARALLWLVLLALIAAAGAGGWYGYQLWQQVDQLQTRTPERTEPFDPSGLEQRLGQLAQTQKRQSQRLEALADNRVDGELLADTARQVDALRNRLEALTDTNRDDWKLAEAAFLLRLASQHVLVQHNTDEALALSRAADEILRAADDPGLFNVRQTLAREITRLQSAETVDREGLYARLQALMDNLPELSQVARFERDFESEPAQPEASAEPAGVWGRIKHSLAGVWGGLTELVRVERQGEPVEPLLSPGQTYYLQQNLRLMLQQAQSAALDGRPEVYAQSLAKARQWLGEYYPGSDRAAVMVEALGELANQPVVAPSPQIGDAHRRLEAYIQRLHQIEPGPEGES